MRRAGVLLLGLMLIGCDPPPDPDPATRAGAAARVIGLTLPASAEVVFADQMHGLDDAARLAMILPVADWQRMERQIDRLAPDAEPASREDCGCLGSDTGTWTPSREHGIMTRQIYWRDGTEVLNVGAAPTAPGKVRVYLFWYET